MNIQGGLLGPGLAYWSASANADNPGDQANIGSAWYVVFGNGLMAPNPTDNLQRVWCVRGPMQADAY